MKTKENTREREFSNPKRNCITLFSRFFQKSVLETDPATNTVDPIFIAKRWALNWVVAAFSVAILTPLNSSAQVNCTTGIDLITTGPFTYCPDASATPLSASITTASGGGAANITYEWFSNTSNSTTGGNRVQVLNTTTATSSSSFIPQTGTPGTLWYYCVVTNTDAGCPATSYSTIPVAVTVNPGPTIADAGFDQSICGTLPVSLTGNDPQVGSGLWTIEAGAGGSFANPTSFETAFTGAPNTTYLLRWTISNGLCASSSDDVSISFYTSPTIPVAGPNQNDIATCGLSTVTLAANTPAVGTGVWAVVVGGGGYFSDDASPTSTFTGLPGVNYTLRWRISNGSCPSLFDDVLVKFNQDPTTADAGTDIGTPATCGLTMINLAANPPAIGTGQWSIISGVGGSFDDDASPTSTFIGVPGTTYTLRWTISSPCSTSEDDVTVVFVPNVTPTVSIMANPGNSICAGTSVTFTAVATNAGSLPSYQWQLNGVDVGTNSNTYTNAALANGQKVKVIVTSSDACANPTTDESNEITITVNPVLVPSVTINASSTDFCSGSLVTFDADITNGGLTPGYQWYVNGSPAGNAASFSSSSLNDNDVVSLEVTSSATCANPQVVTSNSILVTVHPVLPVSLSISESANGICPGSSVTFTASPTNGGATPSYQWKINGSNAGTNSSSFTTTSLSNNDQVTVVLTSNETCVSGSPATSPAISMSVLPAKPVSVNVLASSTNICAGNSVTFTATPTNGGASPSYQWRVNGANAGTNNAVFTSSSLSEGDVVTVLMTSTDGPCLTGNPATSAPVTMTVNPVLPVSVSINASATTICSGSSIVFTATPTNGGFAPSYQWKVDGLNAGINSSTFISSALTNGQIVTVVLTSSEACNSGNPASSIGIPVTVNPVLPASVTVAASANPVCAGSSVTFTATPTNGGASPTYQWQVGGVNQGSATTSNTFTTSGLANGNAVRVIMTSNANCVSGSPATSNTINMTVNPVLTVSVSIAASANPICTGNSVTFTATPINGGGSPSYQWKVNGGNVGTNSSTYTTTGLSNGDQVTVLLTSNASPCASGSPATSNTITTTVNPLPTIALTSVAGSNIQQACRNNALGTNIVYTLTNATGATVSGLPPGITGSYAGGVYTISGTPTSTGTYNYTVTSTSPCTNVSLTGTITVISSPPSIISGSAISGPTSVCPSVSGLVYSVSAISGATSYNFNFPSGWTITSGQGTNSVIVTATGAVANGPNVLTVQAINACGSTSRTYSISVGTFAAVNAGADVSLCSPGTASLAAVLQGAATGITWSAPSGSFSNVNSLTPVYTPSISSGSVTLTATTNDPAGTCPATSDQVVVNVYQPPALTVQPTATTTVCSGTNVSLNATATGSGLTYQWKKNGSALANGGSISGAASSTLNIIGSTTANSGTYTLVVSGSSPCTPATSADAVVMVNQSVAISGQPTNKTVCSGTDVNYTVTATGTGLTYQWYKGATPLSDGGNISGSVAAMLTITGATSANASSDYHVVVSGTPPCSPLTSSIASLTVNDAVAINTPPFASTTVCSGTPINLSVSATGNGLTYQWKKNGSIIGGATGSTYSIASPTSANSGTYTVVVSGISPCPSVTSADAVVIVNDIVAITTQPINKTVCSGTIVNYIVSATGTGLTYQWYKGVTPLSDGGNISGSGTPSLTITGATTSDASPDYHVVVTGAAPCSPITSSIASLMVNDAVIIGTQPVPSTTVCSGTPINLSIVATGTSLSYQWKKDGTNIAGATSDTYSIVNPTASDNGNYTVVVSGTSPCTAVTSTNALVTVNQIVGINTQPVNKTVCSQTNVNFGVVATGTGLTYQWYKGTNPLSDGGNISGSGTATLTITGASAADASSDYHVVVTGTSPCSPVISSSAFLTVNDAVVINTQPLPAQTACSGSAVNLSVVATGTGLTYQWRKGTTSLTNSGNYSGVNTSTLTISNIGTADAANNYSVLITGTSPCSPVASANASISVNRRVVIGTQPSNVGICASNPVSLGVVATGDGLTYQWYKGTPPGTPVVNGGLITGAQSNLLSFSQASLTDDGTYYVVVSGVSPCASITSNAVTLNVDQAIVITTQPIAQTVCENAINTIFTVAANAGGDPLTYQWRKNGVNIGGATSATYTIPTATLGTAGSYDVVITGPAGYTCTTATSATAVLTLTPSVGTPVFSLGANSSICQGSSPVTYTAMATGNTGIVYTLDATSLGAGNSINASTGQVTYAPGWTGASTITATASGCNGPKSASHTVTITPTVGTPTAITGTPPTCQLLNGTTTTNFSTTATNSTGFNWSLSNPAAGSINPSTGVMTWANGFSGSIDIRVMANGCNGPSAMVTRTVTVTATVGSPTAITGTPPACQLVSATTTTTFATTASNNSGFNWSMSNGAAGSIDPATGVMTWANGFSGSVNISVTANGCNGPLAQVSRSISITPSVTTPVFSLGSGSIRCQGAGSVTYTASAVNSTGISYDLDAASKAAGNSINTSTGAVTYAPTWNGITTVSATAAGCNGPVTATHTVTVSPSPVGGTTSPSSSLFACAGSNSGNVSLTGQTGSISKWQYSVNGGATWTDIVSAANPITYTNLTQTTAYRAVLTTGNCPGLTAYSSATTISVVPQSGPGSLSAFASPTVICTGSSTLTAVGFGMDSTVGALTGGAFDNAGTILDGPGRWRAWNTDQGKGGYYNMSANADNQINTPFNLTNGPKTFAGTLYDNDPLVGQPNNNKFMIVAGQNTSTLETPIFNLVGLTSASIDWYEAYILASGGSIKMEISLDGGNTYTSQLRPTVTGPTTYGTPNEGFKKSSVDLSAYVGLSNLRIRFTYTGTATSSWGLEVATITKASLPANYNWNLYNPMPAAGDPPAHYLNVFTAPSVTVTPPSPNNTNTPLTYSYSIVSSAGGCASNITVTVNPVLVTSVATPGQTICSGSAIAPITYNSNIAGTTFNWTRDNSTNVTGIAASGTGIISGNLVNNTSAQQTVIFTITPSAPNTCGATPFTSTVILNPNVVVTLAGGGTICGSNAATLTLSSAGPFPVQATLSDGITYTLNGSPLNISVTPSSNTAYSIVSLPGNNCAAITGSGTATVTVINTIGTTGTWLCSAGDGDWFNPCNWANGIIPTNNIDVIIASASSSCNPVIDPTSPYAAANGPIALSRNITISGTRNLSFQNGGDLHVAGNWINNVGPAGFTANTGTVTFMGNTAQTITSTPGSTEAFYNLVINNTLNGAAAVTLNNPATVSGVLTLTDGIVKTTSVNLLSIINPAVNAVVGGSNSTYVWGPIARNTNSISDYVYPVGNPAGPYGEYRPAITTPVDTSPTTYTAEYHVNAIAAPDLDLSYRGSFLTGILATEHWQIDRSAGSTDAVIKLPYVSPPSASHWDGSSPCTDCSVAIVTPFGLWDFTGGPGYTGGYSPNESVFYGANSMIHTKPMSQFGDFTFGFAFTIILPVKLVTFEAQLVNSDGKLTWKVESTKDLASFDVEHSGDGRNFSKLADVPANPGATTYSYLHPFLAPGSHYYRLLVKEKSGQRFYGKTVMLAASKNLTVIKGLRPTMVTNQTNLSIYSVQSQQMFATLFDVTGRTIAQYKANLITGENNYLINTMTLAQGQYTLQVKTADGIQSNLRFIKE